MERMSRTWAPRREPQPLLVCASYWERDAAPGAHRCRNPLWVLDYSVSDCGRTRVGRRAAWRRRPGGIAHLYPPRTVYWEDFAPNAAICSAYCIFQADPAADAALRALLPAGEAYLRCADPAGELPPLLREAAAAGAGRETGFWRAQGVLLRLLARLGAARHVGAEDHRLGPARPEAASDFVRRVHALFEERLAEKVTLADLARALCVSPSALSHRYAQETGRPPISALIDRRIERAKALLLRGLGLEAVAAQTGFHDAFHLSKTFKKRTGQTPTAFCESVRRPA
jgi:AraC-like DNA-binding protein